jgi:hypothetical protein
MDRDQDDARGFVPRGQMERKSRRRAGGPLEKWQETNTYWTDYTWQTSGLCHRAMVIRLA